MRRDITVNGAARERHDSALEIAENRLCHSKNGD